MKKLKLIMELIYIFIIPLIFMLTCMKIKEDYIYVNGNWETTENKIEFTTPFTYVKDKEFINYFYYKQPLEEITIDGTYTQDTIIKTYRGEYNAPYQLIYGFTELQTNIYMEEINTSQQTYDNLIITRYYNYYDIRIIIKSGTYNNIKIQPYVINITELTYNYNINISNQNIHNLLNELNIDYKQNNGEIIKLESENIISGNYEINYTIWGKLKNIIINNLQIQDNQIINIIITYTILWFIMFIIWHFFYLFFDGLIHIFIDWGHKEKEKTNE